MSRPRRYTSVPDDFRLRDIFHDVFLRLDDTLRSYDIYDVISARCYLNPANANARNHIAIIIIIIIMKISTRSHIIPKDCIYIRCAVRLLIDTNLWHKDGTND